MELLDRNSRSLWDQESYGLATAPVTPALVESPVYAFLLDMIGGSLLWLLSEKDRELTRDDGRRRPLCGIMKAAETAIRAALLGRNVTRSVVVVVDALTCLGCTRGNGGGVEVVELALD